jgi:hypothetical protein
MAAHSVEIPSLFIFFTFPPVVSLITNCPERLALAVVPESCMFIREFHTGKFSKVSFNNAIPCS